MNASPAKLRNGSWGARVEGIAVVGDTLTITTKGGKTWNAVVARIVWQGNGVTLCTTGSPPSSEPARSRTTRTGCSCGSVEEYEKESDCFSCRHDR